MSPSLHAVRLTSHKTNGSSICSICSKFSSLSFWPLYWLRQMTQHLLHRMELCIEHWGPEWTPCGFHMSIIPLLVSALQAGGSPDCGHTVRLPLWMNCSKVMSCTKNLPGNKAWQISLHCNCGRNSAYGQQSLAHLQSVVWHAWRPHAAGVVLVLTDKFWPAIIAHPPTGYMQ